MMCVGLALLARSMIAERAYTEEADHVLQSFGLGRELFSRTGKLFRAGGVSLGNQGNLTDRPVDLVDTSCLLPRCRGYFLHQISRLLNRGHQLVQQST